MSVDLVYASATELLRRYRAKQLSPVEVTQAVLARIRELNPKLNAYCVVDEEAALAAARAAQARWAQGAPLGALDGVPVSIKDLLLTRGWPTLRGSRTV
ncbi:MAG: amidase family protein, partial [Burkholderiales bacterium]